MLKKREKNDRTSFDSCLFTETNGTNGTNTSKLRQGLGQILEKPEMLEDSSYNLSSPLLTDSTPSQHDRDSQLERKVERLESLIVELKSLILDQK